MTSKRDLLASIFWFALLGLIYSVWGVVGLAGAFAGSAGCIVALGICTGYWIGTESDLMVIELMRWAKANPEKVAALLQSQPPQYPQSHGQP